jgi:SAM-dependent methyltransferase
MTVADVPSPIDFHDIVQARAWVAGTVAARPWRPRFFDAVAEALDRHFDRTFAVLELGSGPGHLAAGIVGRCRVSAYLALDRSPAMHQLAREHLGAAAAGVTFVERDFSAPDWPAGLPPVDAVVTLQAAHEVRHKSRQPALLAQARNLIAGGGLFLFCDHYAEPGGGRNPDLYPTRDEQPRLLAEAGFTGILPLLDLGGMALYRAVPATG